MIENAVDKKGNKIDLDDYWEFGARILKGKHCKTVEFFNKVATKVEVFRLKHSVSDECRNVNAWEFQIKKY